MFLKFIWTLISVEKNLVILCACMGSIDDMLVICFESANRGACLFQGGVSQYKLSKSRRDQN